MATDGVLLGTKRSANARPEVIREVYDREGQDCE
jgi:hypothetical protein